jgi:hypothetical protein
MTRLAERLVEAHHVDAAEFMHPMTVGGTSATPLRAPAALPGTRRVLRLEPRLRQLRLNPDAHAHAIRAFLQPVNKLRYLCVRSKARHRKDLGS